MLEQRRHYDLRAYNEVMRADPGELDLTVGSSALEGRLPDELVGATVWLNGPGAIASGGWLTHPFDGHGYLRALRLRSDGARLQARFVRTPAYLAEARAGRMTHRGLGTLVPGGPLANLRAPAPRHVANTAVLPWHGRLWALWEGGLPFALDAETLETLGPETFGGALRETDSLLAHTRLDAATGRLVGVTQRIDGLRTRYEILEIDADARVVARRSFDVDRISIAHDFVITPRYYVFLENALTLDVVGALRARLGLGPLLRAVRPASVPGRVALVPRGGGAARWFSLDRPLFSIHHVNAWDDGDEVHILTCGFRRFRFGSELGYRAPTEPLDPGVRGPDDAQRVLRISIDLRDGRASVAELSPYAVDFPRAHPLGDGLPTTHAWGATTARVGYPDPFDAVAHLDVEEHRTQLWRAGGDRFVGEPLVVPRAGARSQKDAWLVVFVSDGTWRTTELVVLDGANVGARPVASLRLPKFLPYGFHGYVEPARA